MSLDASAPKLAPAFWPVSIAIDDALVSPEIEVVGWRAEPVLECEHRPITIDLRIPFAMAGGTAAQPSTRTVPAR